MQCPVCSHANADDARFCANCGTSLELSCPACSAPYEAGQRFCNQCGTALTGASSADPAPGDLARWVPEELLRKIRAAQSGHTMQGERRTVTMLFADIQGSTAAAEQLDPEEWAEIVNETFGVLIEPVYRYEGTLARLQGDGILAFFGAPIAHEDDPLRAVRAGLDIVSGIETFTSEAAARHEVPVQVRVGINTGLVVVGEVGSDLRVEYTALGDAINVAARMEQTAAPGTVRVAQETLDLIGDGVIAHQIGPVEVKGRSEPVLAHEITGVADLAERTAGSVAPLVGRDQELARLEELVDRLADGLGGICTIVGEAGIGKTRLVHALRGLLEDQQSVADEIGDAGDIDWLQARARSFETSVPHAQFSHLLAGWLGGPDALERPGAVNAAVEALGGLADDDAPAFLAGLVDATPTDEQQALLDSVASQALHVRTTAAVTSLLETAAARRPMVVILDDLHWADSLSLALTEELMGLTEASPLLLVVLMRPMRDDPSWRIIEVAARDHGHRHVAMELDALAGDAADSLLASLLADAAIPDRLHADILRRSAGNPLFVEEMVRALTELEEAGPTSADTLEVPRTLTSLLTSRLDRLDDPTRHIAQVASVVGREFDTGALAALVNDQQFEARVHDLVRRGILEERRRLPRPVYSFRHPLIAETAYNTILLRTRRDLHRRVAGHLEEHDPSAAPEIARHWVEAGEHTAAFPWLVEAGRRAARLMALSDAIANFTTALEHPPDDADPDLVRAAHEGLGEAWSLVPDLSQASSTYQSLLEYGRSCNRPSIQVAALNRLGFSAAALASDYETANDYLRQARSLAEEIGDDLGLAEYHMNACFISSHTGDLDQALLHDSETARIGREIDNDEIRLTGMVRRTLNLMATLRFEEAKASYDEVRDSAEELGDEELLALLEIEVMGMLALRDGRLPDALEIYQRHLPTIDRVLSLYGSASHHELGQCMLLTGDFESALAEMAAVERFGLSLNQDWAIAAGRAGRSQALAVLGATEEISEARSYAINVASSPRGEFLSTTILTNIGLASLAQGDVATARTDLEQARSASSINQAWERPRVLLGLARCHLTDAAVTMARQLLDETRTYIATHGLLLHEPELFLLDGWLAELEGRLDDAATVLTECARAATESGRRPLRIEGLRRLATVRRRQGDSMEAAALEERADAVVSDLAAAIADEELRRGFEARMAAAGRAESA